MIPAFISISGAPWDVLPPGVHPATLAEVEAQFAYNKWRRDLFGGLLQAARALHFAGCTRLYPDGSFVTDKPVPSDYDAAWDWTGVARARLDPVFETFDPGRATQKARYLGEFFPAAALNGSSGQTFLDFFQTEKHTGQRKGILLIDLTTDPMIPTASP